MMVFTAIAFAALGSIIGSFLNVLVLRKGVLSLSGRSHCPSCGKNIAAYDLVPILSWILLRGRCRYCGSAISWQYPLVELLTAILFALVGVAFFPAFFLSTAVLIRLIAVLVVVSLFVAITVYDFRHTIIPDEWVYLLALIAFLISFSQFPTLATALAGPLAALPLFLLWLISRGAWMGLGDAKLALGIGWILMQPAGIVAIFFSFILGSVVLVPVLAAQVIVTHIREGRNAQRGLTMKSEVPFGPFLIAACLIFWFVQLYGVNIPLYILGL